MKTLPKPKSAYTEENSKIEILAACQVFTLRFGHCTQHIGKQRPSGLLPRRVVDMRAGNAETHGVSNGCMLNHVGGVGNI